MLERKSPTVISLQKTKFSWKTSNLMENVIFCAVYAAMKTPFYSIISNLQILIKNITRKKLKPKVFQCFQIE